MRRIGLIWICFFLFLALGLGAMGWMTRTVLQLDAAQARATVSAQLEEDVRLALWRMDYALAPILSQEMARPYFEYQPVFPAERAYTRMYTEWKNGDVLVPSPLLRFPYSTYVALHFQLGPDGAVTSPQVPAKNVRKLAEERYSTPEQVKAAGELLDRLRPLLSKQSTVFASLPEPRNAEDWQGNRIRVNINGGISGAMGTITNSGALNIGNLTSNASNTITLNPSIANGQSLANSANPSANLALNTTSQQLAPLNQYDFQQQAAVQQRKGQQEYNARAQTFDNNNDVAGGGNFYNYKTPGVEASVMKPLWLNEQTLVLARRVTVNGGSYIQGCVLDWPAIRGWLLDLSKEPDRPLQADLVPVLQPTDQAQPRMLATIPVRLVVAEEEQRVNGGHAFLALLWQRSPLHVTLVIAWVGALLAAGAVGIMLRNVIALSQRRAGFVSAVTHELRTPLTTLRMYTEMLADGIITDPEKQATYHKTLRAEADRLGHLVENVLLYSRLERSARDARLEEAPLGALLDRITPRLTDRAVQAGMMLCMSVTEEARQARIRANLLSVEQILFNLVDNACKYASGTPDHRIEFSVDRTDGRVELCVRDHGPGLPPTVRSRLFKPFSKSVQEAANSAPGLGLGLALSYRLARNMGATLRLDESNTEGTAFVLSIPAGAKVEAEAG